VNPAVVLFAVVAAAGAALATGLWRPATPRTQDKYSAKLAGIGEHALSLEEIELSQPFTQRFLVPMRDRLIRMLTDRTPAQQQDKLRQLLQTAGHPYGLSVSGVLLAKAIAAGLTALLVAFFFLPFVGLKFPVNLIGLAAGFLGWILPDRWLSQQGNKRRRAIEEVIPDTIDLLTICLDAGLSFDAALIQIADKVEGPLHDELNAMITEVRYGRPRGEALEGLAARLAVDDLSAFVNAVVQSQKLGVPLGETVRIQATEIRRRRRQKAEEKAAQASLKMLFPMIGCIFPTLFIVLMGPVALLLTSKH